MAPLTNAQTVHLHLRYHIELMDGKQGIKGVSMMHLLNSAKDLKQIGAFLIEIGQ